MTRLCDSPLFTLVNVVLLVAGGCGLGAWFLFVRDEVLLSKCPQCADVGTISIAVCAFVASLGFLGLLATEMRSKVTMVFYKIGLFVVFCLAVIFLAGVNFLRFGKLNWLLEAGWNDASAQVVCEFEALFDCSGWTATCTKESLINGTVECPPCSHFNITIPAILKPGGGQTCNTVITNAVDSNYHNLLIGGAIALGVVGVINFLAYCAGRRFSWIYDESDYVMERPPRNRGYSLQSRELSPRTRSRLLYETT